MNKEEEEDDDEGEYTRNDDDTNDESRNTEEEESEENDNKEEENDTTKSSILCCSGDLCEQEGGQAIIEMSHKCIVCGGQFHGFPCSNGKVQEMNGMTCKQCDTDDMAWAKDTEKIGNEEGNEEW